MTKGQGMSIYRARMRCAAVVGADVSSATQSAMAEFYAQGG